jgi:hypothetical protein
MRSREDLLQTRTLNRFMLPLDDGSMPKITVSCVKIIVASQPFQFLCTQTRSQSYQTPSEKRFFPCFAFKLGYFKAQTIFSNATNTKA